MDMGFSHRKVICPAIRALSRRSSSETGESASRASAAGGVLPYGTSGLPMPSDAIAPEPSLSRVHSANNHESDGNPMRSTRPARGSPKARRRSPR